MNALTVYTLLWLGFGKIFAVILVEIATKTEYAKLRRYCKNRQPLPNQTSREWRGVFLITSDALVLIAAMQLKMIVFTDETWINIGTTVLAMLLWVDFWMYLTHRWMHSSRWLWLIHKTHHISKVVQPSSALCFSAFEKIVFYSMGWIGGAAVMSHFIQISYIGLIAYYSLYFFLSALGHCNVVFFPERGIIPSPAVHALHHLQPNTNFGFYTTTYDRLFGTYRSPDSEISQYI